MVSCKDCSETPLNTYWETLVSTNLELGQSLGHSLTHSQTFELRDLSRCAVQPKRQINAIFFNPNEERTQTYIHSEIFMETYELDVTLLVSSFNITIISLTK